MNTSTSLLVSAPFLAPSSPSMPTIFEVKDLALSWDKTPIVQGVSLKLAAGEIACLVGRSGSGKTTILHALSGLTAPDGGEILLHGSSAAGQPGQVSYMFQKDLLLPSRRLIDNVVLPLVIAGKPLKAARDQACPLFETFGLAGKEEVWPYELSGGMRQRAALLRTYLMGNEVVLLDEPFSALDAITRSEIRSWFCNLVQELGLAALVVTHDVDEALQMAQHIYALASPGAGKPATIVGELDVARPEDPGSMPFELTDAFLAQKRKLLSFLDEPA